ncbi:MAG TPA: primosomal protein N' [Mycobacteriales bacterium]|nr:primosomal protein N' [Mycobacteriales bacterium]
MRPARRGARPHPSASSLPVARVAVDVPLPHLDRPFDYLVPARLADVAQPGVRVRVRFSGQLVDGFLLERAERSEHSRPLLPLVAVVSPEPALATEIARLARAVADHYAGTLADVLRLAVPPRHARVEAEPVSPALPDPVPAPDAGSWARYADGPALLTALARGGAPRAVWTALPGTSWPGEVAAAVRATLAGARGALVVVPDGRDVARVDHALTAALGHGRHVALTADLGPAERYRRWLAVRRGSVRAVVGTRATMFAPVAELGLVLVWDDGDDLHAEPRAPHPHVRDVLVRRAHLAGAAALVGGFSRTAEGQLLVDTGWARALAARRSTVRAIAPRVHALGDDAELARDPAAAAARLPTLAWRVARGALAAGAPVLVQVPRRGYLPAVRCARCRAPTRCPDCAGPLGTADASSPPACRWCGRSAPAWRCPRCGGPRLRAVVVGAQRTAEELGRAFPGVPVRTSGREDVLERVSEEPLLVVATPGAEPVVDGRGGGYGAALLLDGWALLGRADLRAAEEALRRWCGAAALVRPAAAGGCTVVVADVAVPAVQALVRWDPAWHAARELAERAALRFPPATRVACLTGSPAALAAAVRSLALPASADVLGPVPATDHPRGGGGDEQRLLVRAARGDGTALAGALATLQRTRSARKESEPLRIVLDPLVVA